MTTRLTKTNRMMKMILAAGSLAAVTTLGSACEEDEPAPKVVTTDGAAGAGGSGSGGQGGTGPQDAGTPRDTAMAPGSDAASFADGAAAPAPDTAPPLWSLASVTIDPSGSRRTYIQTLTSLDVAEVNNKNAIEVAGNATHLAANGHVYVGFAEEPTIKRYTPDAAGQLRETGKVSFLNLGWKRAPFGNAIASPSRAYSIGDNIISVWDPSKMELVTTIELKSFNKDPYEPEFWTTVARDGRVYVPVRYADWKGGAIDKSVTLIIIDVTTDKVAGVARDQRCGNAGRPIFMPNGDLYVVADGRNHSAQMYAQAAGKPLPVNCILRIRKGETAFDPNFMVEVPKLTGGYEVATEIEAGAEGTGIGFAKMFYPEKLPAGVKVETDFKYWGSPAFLYWRLELGDVPKAKPVEGVQFSSLSFSGSATDGKLYVNEGDAHDSQVIVEIDPATNKATRKFKMQGNMYGLHRIR